MVGVTVGGVIVPVGVAVWVAVAVPVTVGVAVGCSSFRNIGRYTTQVAKGDSQLSEPAAVGT